MHVQTSFTASKHLPFRDSVFVDFERRGGLETSYHSETDFVRNSEVVKRRAEHRQPCSAVTFDFV